MPFWTFTTKQKKQKVNERRCVAYCSPSREAAVQRECQLNGSYAAHYRPSLVKCPRSDQADQQSVNHSPAKPNARPDLSPVDPFTAITIWSAQSLPQKMWLGRMIS
jgi:hypothetical protein